MPNIPNDEQHAGHATTGLGHSTHDDGRLRLSLNQEITELERLAEEVESFAAGQGWPSALIMQINLVLEEIIVNTMNYGYPDGRVGNIELTMEVDPDEIRIQIEDDANPYDPFTEAPAPDLSAGLEDRPIGGLGVYLVQSYMDICMYQRAPGRNLISLVKRLPAHLPS